MRLKHRCLTSLIALPLATGLAPETLGVNGSWTNNAAGNWSATNHWDGGVLADGAGFTAWFTNNISAARTVTIDITPRILGILNLGDADGTHAFTLAATGAGKLTLNNGGADAQLYQTVSSRGDIISAPLALGDSTVIANASTNQLTISGSITSAVAGVRLLSNNSPGTGVVALGGIIGNGAGTLAVVQDSVTSLLSLSGANTFTGGLFIKSGTVRGLTSVNAFGANASVITLGDGAGSADATLSGGVAGTFANPIAVASGNTGAATITDTAASIFSGAVTLYDHDLILSPAASALTLSGGTAGAGSLVLAAGGAGALTLSTKSVNHRGAIINSSTGPALVSISAGVGSNVTAITEASTNSALTLTGVLTVNPGGTILANNNAAGSALLTVAGGVYGAGDLVLNNNSAIPNGITLMTAAVTNAGRIINSGSGAGNSLISAIMGTNVTGVVQNSGASPLVLSAANTYPGGTEVLSGKLLVSNVTGFATGPGPVNVYSGGMLQGKGSMAGTVTNRHGGILSPGFDGVPGGTLTIGNLAWNGGGIFACKIASLDNNEAGAGLDYDQLIVTNTLTAVPAGSNLVIRLDSLGQTLTFETNRNYSLKVITCLKGAVLNPADVTLDTNAFLVDGVWTVTNLNNAIYVTCLGEVATNKNSWRGTGNWSTATNWSLGHAPLPGEDVEFDFLGIANCTADAVSNNLGSLTLAAGYTGTLIASNLTIAGNCLIAKGVLTHAANGTTAQGERYKIILTVGGDLTIASNGLISADGKGYAAGHGPGSIAGGGGGSYGGRGCPYYHTGGQLPGPTYGSIVAPTNLGSGGGNFAGGGAVRLVVAGTTTVHGVISAGGGFSPGNERSGSGGSVFLTTGQLMGNGILKANSGEATGYGGNSGGGGRIAVVLTNSADTGEVRLQAYASAGRNLGTGAGGTVYVETTNHVPECGRLIVDYGDVIPWNRTLGVTEQNGLNASSYAFSEIILTNGGVYALDANDTLDITGATLSGDPVDRFDGLYVNGGTLIFPPALSWSNYFIGIGTTNTPFAPASLTVGTNATLKMDVPWVVTFPFTLEAGGWLSHSANTTNEAYKLNLTFNGDLDIPAGAEINVEGMGYSAANGPGKGTDAGGYGGMGGFRNGTGGSTYGSLTAPTNLGSGGSVAPGGGSVQLTVTGTATVNGVISAANTARTLTSVGSGGSVYLRAAAVKGTGALRANSVNTSGNASSGGGGRIAVILTNSSEFAGLSLQANAGGGSANYSGIGGAGTIYLETADQGPGQGTLLIDASNRYWSTTSWLGLTLISSQVSDTGVGSVILTNGAIFKLDTNQTLTVNGSWTNAATFIAAINSTVILAGTDAATVAGSNAFYNLTSTNAGKIVSFQAGRTNLVSGLLKLGSADPGSTVTLQSTVDGSWWYLNLTTNPGGAQEIARVTVKDSHAGGGQLLVAARGSSDLGHNINWQIPRGGTVILVR